MCFLFKRVSCVFAHTRLFHKNATPASARPGARPFWVWFSSNSPELRTPKCCGSGPASCVLGVSLDRWGLKPRVVFMKRVFNVGREESWSPRASFQIKKPLRVQGETKEWGIHTQESLWSESAVVCVCVCSVQRSSPANLLVLAKKSLHHTFTLTHKHTADH